MFANFFQRNIKSVNENFCTDKGTCRGTQKTEENTNQRTNVRLQHMLKEGKHYAVVGRHCGIKESSVRHMKKEEYTKFRTLSVSKQEKMLVCVREKQKIV